MKKTLATALLALLAALPLGCGDHGHPHEADGSHPGESGETTEPFAVTAWGARYEVFAETEPLVAGGTSSSGVHVTILDGFQPLLDGSVTVVVGSERFTATKAVRPGIFRVPVAPSAEGVSALSFEIVSAAGTETIPGPKVRVGSRQKPGGLVGEAGAADAAEATSFLKEQQWKTPFATAAAAEEALASAVSGPARVLPVPGGETLLTAPFDAVVSAARWPHPGLAVRAGEAVFSLLPRVASERSVADLEASVASLDADERAARERLVRLRELLPLEATSTREVREAEAAATSLAARLDAAKRDLASARAAREGRPGSGTAVPLPAPFAGRVAEVRVSPGQSVAAGEALARLVKPEPVLVEIALAPADAARVTSAPGGLVLERAGGSPPLALRGAAIRLLSRAPEIDAATGTRKVLVEARASADVLPIGSRLGASLLLGAGERGVVLASSALVDDAGQLVAYVQVEGESFARRAVTVRVRQGGRVLVDGIAPGERVVLTGASAIRRSELVSGGGVQGHVH
jgi:RND family efflux transporter MFP subunit